MKLELLQKELMTKLPEDTHVYQSKLDWINYFAISGLIGEEYFDISLRERVKGKYIIEIIQTTDNPKHILNIIKGIDKDCVVKYYDIKFVEKIG